MGALFLRLVNISITASWLILAVTVLRLLLKKAPKYIRFLLWAMVAIRLLCPFSFESTLSLVPNTETIARSAIYENVPRIEYQAVNEREQSSTAHNNPEHSVRVPHSVTFSDYASFLWLMGIAAMLIYSAISYVRLRSRVAAAILLRDNIWQCEAVTTPFILGFVHPRIYLPFDLDEDNMDYAVAHEKAHIKRRDHRIKPLGFLLLTVYWFNPMIWLAYILLCRDIELACDEHVICNMDAESKKAYSKALLTCSIPRRSIAACPLAFGEGGIKTRIKNVLTYRKPAFWIVIAAIAVCVVVAVCFLTNPKSVDPSKVIGEYDTGTPAGEYLNSGNPAYEIGMNAYGKPIFADADGAFNAIKEDLAQGFLYLANEFNLTEVTKENYQSYKTFGRQTGAKDDEVRSQCVQISQFFDIYENSFSKSPAVNTQSALPGSSSVFTGGKLLGQLGGLSYLPRDGSYYEQIILSDMRLTVVSSEGKTLYDGDEYIVSRYSYDELINRLKDEFVFWQEGAEIPQYESEKDMAVYSYYSSEDSSDFICSIYCFNGEPAWFAEGELLRFYELVQVSNVSEIGGAEVPEGVNFDRIPVNHLPDDYSLEAAKEDGCVVFEDADITAGQSIWDAFVAAVNRDEHASVRLAYYYTLGDPSKYAPEHYEEIKNDYPVLFVKELTYDGEGYTIKGIEDGEMISQQYKFLMKYEGEPDSKWAVYSEYLYYVLTNDETVTREDILHGLFSSKWGDYIDHYKVYSDLTYG